MSAPERFRLFDMATVRPFALCPISMAPVDKTFSIETAIASGLVSAASDIVADASQKPIITPGNEFRATVFTVCCNLAFMVLPPAALLCTSRAVKREASARDNGVLLSPFTTPGRSVAPQRRHHLAREGYLGAGPCVDLNE